MAAPILRALLVLAGSSVIFGCRRSSEPPPRYAPPLPEGGRVFFVGNSFFGWGDRPLPQWVAALGAASSPEVHFEVGGDIVFGDTPLAEFMDHPATQAALASGGYDVFVLQGHELECVDERESFHAAVRSFDARVREAGARTVLFMTWDFPWRPFVDDVARSYDDIGRELSLPVIPAGLAYAAARRDRPDGAPQWWLTASPEKPDGDLHQNAAGSLLNAYLTFATLTGRDPQATMFAAPGNDNDAATAQRLSRLAWAAVKPRLKEAP